MLIATLILLTLTGAAIFAAPLRCKAWVALAFVVLFALGGTAAAVGALAGILPPAGLSLPTLLFGEESLRMDALSALFTLLVAAGSVAAALYAKGYVDRYLDRKPAAHISLHYFAFTLLSLSMTAVVTASGGYTFLFWWELMTLSSFVLILFDAERKEVLKAALTYLVMMHLGFFALLIGFVVLQAAEGSADFGALAGYFAAHRPLPLLLVFLAGFGMKSLPEVGRQKIEIFADRYTTIDEKSIPTGTADVTGTPFDLRAPVKIADGLALETENEQLKNGQGYDHNFILSGEKDENGLRLAARVTDERTGRVMKVFTDMPGVQFYSGNFLNRYNAAEHRYYKKRMALCLETQCAPDSVHHVGENGFDVMTIEPGRPLDSTTVYQFETL